MSNKTQEEIVTPTDRHANQAREIEQVPTAHRWRRWLAGVAAVVSTVSASLVVAPSLPAGAATALNQVIQGSTGTAPSVGNPQPAATAKLSTLSSSAVNPTTGDVAEVDGNQVFLLIEESNEPATDYGLGTTGTLTKGDVYLVGGNGEPGWTSQTSNAGTATPPVKATTTIIGKPQVATFDAAGNLLIGSNATGEANVVAIPKTTATAYGYSTAKAGYPYFIAGYTASTATNPPAPAIKLGKDVTFTSLAASGGIKVGSTQDVVVGSLASGTTTVSVLNFSTTQTLYGVSVLGSSFTEVAGGGSGACSAGVQHLAATGSSAFTVATPRVFVDGNGNLYVGNAGTTQCSWVLPKISGTLVLDGTKTSVTAGTAYKWAGTGTNPKTTAPTNGASAVTTSIGLVNGVTEDPAGNIVFLMGGSTQTTTKLNGAYVIANSSGTYYGQNMTAGDFYTIAGSATHTLGKFKSPFAIGSDSTGNLWITDANAHILYELTGGPTGPALPATTTTVSSSTSGSSVFGQSVTFTATVTTVGATAPTGKVTFKDGSTVIGSGTLATHSGHKTATFTTSSLSVADHSITAVYGGDANNAPSHVDDADPDSGQGQHHHDGHLVEEPLEGGSVGDLHRHRAPSPAPGTGVADRPGDIQEGLHSARHDTLSTSGGHDTATFATTSPLGGHRPHHRRLCHDHRLHGFHVGGG